MNSVSKVTINKLATEKLKNNEYIQNKDNDSNQIDKFATPKNPAKLKTLDNKDLNDFVSLNRFKVIEEKEIDQYD